MGGSKELCLLDAIKNGDTNGAIKLLTKSSIFRKRLFSGSSSSSKHNSTNAYNDYYDGETNRNSITRMRSSSVGHNDNYNNQSNLICRFKNKFKEIHHSDGPGVILNNKINVNFQNENGLTCLHQSCINGNVEIAKILIDYCGAQIDIRDNNGYTPLHYACQHGKLDIVFMLLTHHNQTGDIDFMNEPSISNNDTPLHLAIQFSNSSTSSSAFSTNINDKIVQLLLQHGAYMSLPILNKSSKQTPFELACELGRTKIVDLIIRYCLNENFNSELIKKMNKTLSKKTPKINKLTDLICNLNGLHLACKNGHDDIIRLLLINNLCDVNKVSEIHNGTGLHEAARYGRYQTCKLLLESGCDPNIPNNSKQKAVDCIIKHVKIGNDIKFLIKEYSQFVRAISIEPYVNNHAGALCFNMNELINILDYSNQKAELRGFILDKASFTCRYGYFPSSHVKLIDSKLNVNINNDLMLSTNGALNSSGSTNSSQYSTNTVNNNKKPFATSSTTSLLTKEAQIVHQSFNLTDDFLDGISIIENNEKKMTFNDVKNGLNHLMSFASLSQNNPSPSSSSSLNSSPLYSKPSLFKKLLLKSSSSSINVSDLLKSDPNQTSLVILNLLQNFNLQQYYDNFLSNGYDLLTILKATPADLSAIGIIDPAHRNLIHKEIQSSFRILDDLDDSLISYLSAVKTIDDLFEILNFESYLNEVKRLAYFKDLNDFLNTLSWEDLEEIGIKKLGHQKKLMFVVKKMKEILNNRTLNKTSLNLPSLNSFSNSNILAKSLENIHVLPNLTDSLESSSKLTISQNNSNRSKLDDVNEGSKQPPLPPRTSSVSSYATLPRNRANKNSKSSLLNEENNKLIKTSENEEINHAQQIRPTSSSSSSQTSQTSSGSAISPSYSTSSSSSSPSPLEQLADPILPPPPMPILMSNLDFYSNDSNTNNIKRLINNNFNPRQPISIKSNNFQQQQLHYIKTKNQIPSRDMNLVFHQNQAQNQNSHNLNDIDLMLCDLNKQLDSMLTTKSDFNNC